MWKSLRKKPSKLKLFYGGRFESNDKRIFVEFIKISKKIYIFVITYVKIIYIYLLEKTVLKEYVRAEFVFSLY